MRKATLIPLLIIIVGVCLALAGFAAGGMKTLWFDRVGFHLAPPAAPLAPTPPTPPAAPDAPDAPVPPEVPVPPEAPSLWGWAKGFWFERGGSSAANLGSLITVDESYDSFSSITLNADFIGSVTLKEGSGYAVRGQNYERFGGLNARLDGETLYVDATRDRRWMRYSFDGLFGSAERDTWVEITYPKGADLSLVNADLSAGRINASGLDCEELYIDNSFGRIDVSTVLCDRLTVNSASGDTQLAGINVRGNAVVDNDFGNVSLTNIIAGSLTVDLNAGNAKVTGVTAESLSVSNDFGKIGLKDIETDSLRLNLNSGDLEAESIKTFDLFAKSSFGLVRFDRLELSGRAEIDQSSGDVNISLDLREDDLSYELGTDAGNVNIDGRRSGNSVYNRNTEAEASLSVTSNFGNITLKFLK